MKVSESPSGAQHQPHPHRSGQPLGMFILAPLREATFTLFPQLPPELRRMIWQSTIEPQMTVLSSCEPILANPHTGTSATSSRYPKPSILMPVILHVNQESRHEALRKYKLIEFAQHSDPVRNCSFPLQAVYMCFDIDTLKLYGSTNFLLRSLANEQLSGLKRLEVVTSDREAPPLVVAKAGEELKCLKWFNLVIGGEQVGGDGTEGKWFVMHHGFGREYEGGSCFTWIADGKDVIWDAC